MIDLNRSRFPEKFDVRVGFQCVRVEGASPAEAVRNARRALCAAFPRLYDVIRQLDDSRFSVEPVNQ